MTINSVQNRWIVGRPGVWGLMLVATLLALTFAPAQSSPYQTRYVRLSSQAYGVLYSPIAGNPAFKVGLINMHPNGNRLDGLACAEFAKRGFPILCMNGRYTNSERETMIWEKVPLDVKPAVEYLRGLPEVDHVILLGGSGGGPLMSFYQNVAENGPKACQVPGRLVQCTDELEGLPPADAVILRDPHFGYGGLFLSMLDPAVVDEENPLAIDPSLDLFNPENGYRRAGSTYSPEFKRRYFRAQAERLNRLTRLAQQRSEKIARGEGDYQDDEPLIIGRVNARMWQTDRSLISHTKKSYPILKADGSIKVEIPRSVRVANLFPENNAVLAGAQINTVNAFLSNHVIRTTPDYFVSEDAVEGVDWNSSSTSTPANLAGIRSPLLMMGMTGFYWMVLHETFYEYSGSSDKTLVFVEGAAHGVVPCQACESTPGQYGDTVKRAFDFAAEWIHERFPEE